MDFTAAVMAVDTPLNMEEPAENVPYSRLPAPMARQDSVVDAEMSPDQLIARVDAIDAAQKKKGKNKVSCSTRNMLVRRHFRSNPKHNAWRTEHTARTAVQRGQRTARSA